MLNIFMYNVDRNFSFRYFVNRPFDDIGESEKQLKSESLK